MVRLCLWCHDYSRITGDLHIKREKINIFSLLLPYIITIELVLLYNRATLCKSIAVLLSLTLANSQVVVLTAIRYWQITISYLLRINIIVLYFLSHLINVMLIFWEQLIFAFSFLQLRNIWVGSLQLIIASCLDNFWGLLTIPIFLYKQSRSYLRMVHTCINYTSCIIYYIW